MSNTEENTAGRREERGGRRWRKREEKWEVQKKENGGKRLTVFIRGVTEKEKRGSPPLRWGGFKDGDEKVGSRAEWNYERRGGQKNVKRRWLIGLRRLGGGWG